MKLSYILRRAPKAPTLRERAAALRASLSHQDPIAEQTAAPHAGQPDEPPSAIEPDPALAVAADHLAAWNAAEAASHATGDVPDEVASALGDAYDRLRAVRPTTAAGFRALAEAWALELNGERGNEPSLMLADHAADSLIAGAEVCVPTEIGDDAELLRLGAQLDAAHAEWRAAVEANREPGERLQRALSEARSRGGPTALELRAAWEQPGVTEAHAAEDRAFDNLHPICDAIWQAPARTPAGLAVKARAALVHIWPRGQFEADAAPGEDEGLTNEAARRLIEACCATAGVNWKGEPLDSSPLTLQGADPALAAIEAHQTAYAEWDRLASVWNEMEADDPGYAAAMAASDLPGRREVETYEALFTTQPTTLQGAKALAAYFVTAVRTASIDAEPSDGERALRVISEALGNLSGPQAMDGAVCDWQAWAAHHPGFVPYPAHAPASLMALDLAIRGEAERFLRLAEEEIERRWLAYSGFPDPAVWPRVERWLRRELRMDALALVAAEPMDDGETLDQTEADALVSAIEAEWAVWAAFDDADPDDGDPAFEATLARRQVLLNAADALPADSRAARHAKALALAWLEYTDLWERGRRYEDYATDGRLALAIHAALAGSPVPAGPKPRAPSLVSMIDFASASMDELRALHDTANEVGSFAYAMTWSGRCRDGTQPARRMPGDGLNAVGRLMLWLGDALASVETAALEEAKRRAPDNTVDRSTRLELMARPILENDDPDQIEAFGRELLAHAAAERARS